MAGFKNIRQYVDAMNNGQTSFCSFRKVPSQASTARWWVDLSMAAGNPLPNYYASSPLVAATLDGNRGVFHGADKSPQNKYLAEWGIMTPTTALTGPYNLLDYLIYYPFIDLDDTDVQTMDNTVTLPRYTSGDGVRAMFVCVAPTTGGGSGVFEYVNQDGVTRSGIAFSLPTTASTIAQLLTAPATASATAAPFLPLYPGDTGIRSITSLQLSTPGGGLGCIVLVRPIATNVVYEISNMSEKEFVSTVPGCPKIEDGAYLNMIMNCAASVAAGQVAGFCRFVWN